MLSAWLNTFTDLSNISKINFIKPVIVRSVFVRGDASDDSYVTKVAIHASTNGVDWLKVDEEGLDEEEQLVFRANTDSTSEVEVIIIQCICIKLYEKLFILPK